MPRKRTAKHLPRTMTQLAIVMEGKPLPLGVDKVFEIVRSAMKDKDGKHNPITTVNRKFGQLKRRDPDSLKAMNDWLYDKITIQQLTGWGQSGNRDIWVNAIEKTLAGDTAISAFGSKPGPQTSWEFLKSHSQGIRVLYKVRFEKLPPEQAIKQALEEGGLIDDRDMRRSYSTIKNMGISDETLKQLSKT